MINNFNLKQKLIFLALAPLTLALFFSYSLIKQTYQQSYNAGEINELLSLATLNSNLVHELQKERGLTAGYIGSNGAKEFKEKLTQQRRLTDELKAKKLAMYSEHPEFFTSSLLAQAKTNNTHAINQLQSIREQVDKKQITSQKAIGYYTKTNASLLHVIEVISKTSHSAKIEQQSLAYYFFTQAKERAGIERAVLSSVFANNSFSLDVYLKFRELILLQKTFLHDFEGLASEELLIFYNNKMNLPDIKQVTTYRNIAIDKNLKGNFNIDAVDWFNSATKRINILKETETHIAENLLALSEKERSKATTENYFYIILLLIFGLSTLITAYYVIKRINQKFNELIELLTYSAKNNALDRTITSNSNDEFKEIFAALTHVFVSFRTTIKELNDNSNSLAASSVQNSHSVQETSNTLLHQKEQVYLIAAAVEQMATTIQEVSKNTIDAADASNNVDSLIQSSAQVTVESIEQIKMVSDDVNNVHDLISSLHSSTNDMTNVIDVIKAVAEQTNLLALNAAIEAARAGEQGRGFSVVADEVRTLAQRTQESTTQIEKIISSFTKISEQSFVLIENCQTNANLSVEKSQSITDFINDIQLSITKISDMTTQIATATEEQVVVAADISENISKISDGADESAVASEQIAQTSENQAELAKNLQRLSNKFII